MYTDRRSPLRWPLGGSPAESLGRFVNSPESVRKFIERLGGGRELKVCYEAGPTGYALFWQLTTWVPPDRWIFRVNLTSRRYQKARS
jgi:hypothetical protein